MNWILNKFVSWCFHEWELVSVCCGSDEVPVMKYKCKICGKTRESAIQYEEYIRLMND